MEARVSKGALGNPLQAGGGRVVAGNDQVRAGRNDGCFQRVPPNSAIRIMLIDCIGFEQRMNMWRPDADSKPTRATPIPNAHLLARVEWQAAEHVAVLRIRKRHTYEVRAGRGLRNDSKGDYWDIGRTIVINSAPADSIIQGFYLPFLPAVIRDLHPRLLIFDFFTGRTGRLSQRQRRPHPFQQHALHPLRQRKHPSHPGNMAGTWKTKKRPTAKPKKRTKRIESEKRGVEKKWTSHSESV